MQIPEFKMIDLNALDSSEIQEISGGAWPNWLKGITLAAVGKEIIDHWDEIKKGLVDGWNSVKQ
ncbi:MAG: hypothetical protein ACOYVG_04220 [Bacteroidota bacterium]